MPSSVSVRVESVVHGSKNWCQVSFGSHNGGTATTASVVLGVLVDALTAGPRSWTRLIELISFIRVGQLHNVVYDDALFDDALERIVHNVIAARDGSTLVVYRYLASGCPLSGQSGRGVAEVVRVPTSSRHQRDA